MIQSSLDNFRTADGAQERLEFQYCFGFSFCCYDKIPSQKQPLGGRAYFSSQLQGSLLQQKSQGGRTIEQVVTRCL